MNYYFIFEGIDGAGKSTIIKMVKKRASVDAQGVALLVSVFNKKGEPVGSPFCAFYESKCSQKRNQRET